MRAHGKRWRGVGSTQLTERLGEPVDYGRRVLDTGMEMGGEEKNYGNSQMGFIVSSLDCPLPLFFPLVCMCVLRQGSSWVGLPVLELTL